jgi:GT2 family glycosyltransferase
LEKKDPHSLYVVITDFNGHDQTKYCLDALFACSGIRFGVIVVDHGTTQNTREMLQEHFPKVVVLPDSSEKWWSGATNTGISYALQAGAKTLMLLNSDCYLDDGALEELLQLHCLYPEAIIAPVQRDWKTGATLSVRLRCLFLLGFPSLMLSSRITEKIKEKRIVKTGLIGGGRSVIIPKNVFDQIGLFDETHLPHYGADHDFYLRARKRGIQLLIATRATAIVDDTRTSQAKDPGRLSLTKFLETFRSQKSHLNIADVETLFRKHYPIKRFHWLGVALYLGRYSILYIIRRWIFLIRT